MISDKERREVATRLRETCDEIEHDGNGLTVWELSDVLNIRDDDSGMTESLNLDDARNLADLIDRPTCEMRGHPEAPYGVCTRCGAFVRRDAVTDCTSVIPVKYCPNCGAEVMTRDE